MTWSVSQAKARLSEVIAKARRSPQVIESRGEEVAVVLSKAEYERLQSLSAVPPKTGIQKWLELTERLRAEGELNLELPSRELDVELERNRPIPFADEE